MEIKTNVPLAPLATFGIGGPAEYFVRVSSEKELQEAVRYGQQHDLPITILAGGSNVLIADSGIYGLVVKNDILGAQFKGDGEDVIVHAGAGENFDSLVAECVSKDLWGLENLSAIPGSVGATPIQNVGAYGAEVKDVLEYVCVYDTHHDAFKTLTPEECRFGYRDSIFKHPEGKQYIITSVAYRLSHTPCLQLSYKDLAERFKNSTPTLQAIRDAVIEIRKRKFPDWRVTGTAGSFFKNPIVKHAVFSELQKKYRDVPGFLVDADHIKIPLGWIIEHVLHKRGYRCGNVGTFAGQALVVVNHGGATARETETFAEKISKDIFLATGIVPEWEVTKL